MNHSITPLEAERVVDETRVLFQRTLSIWASQLLELDRIGVRTPTWNSVVPLQDLDDWSIAA